MHPGAAIRGLHPSHNNTVGLTRPKTKLVSTPNQKPSLISPTLAHRVPDLTHKTDLFAPRHNSHLLADAPAFVPVSQIQEIPQLLETTLGIESAAPISNAAERTAVDEHQVEFEPDFPTQPQYPVELQPLPYGAYPMYPPGIPAYGAVPFPQFAYPPPGVVPMYAYSAYPMTAYSYANHAMKKPAPRRSVPSFQPHTPINMAPVLPPYIMAPPIDYYAYSAPLLDQSQFGAKENPAFFDPFLTAEDLYQNIMTHVNNNEKIRVSWLNRLLSKVETQEEFEKSLEVYLRYADRNIDLTGETGTLLIKAACRANFAERILVMLCDPVMRLWPTIGGIHYLMINFSLKKDTHSVMKAFTAAKIRNLDPSARTFHIVIRECVDNNLTEDALHFALQFKEFNVVPNRVTFNILMNGCRKLNRPEEILKLRVEMNELKIDINDTTVKFTALAHMMMGNLGEAVEEFLSYPGLDTKLEEFSMKFLEVTEENDAFQNKCVAELLRAVEGRGFILPESLQFKLKQLEENI